MTDDDDIDRQAILARRQRFIVMAIAGLSGLAPRSSIAAPAESPAPAPAEPPPASEPICVYPGDDLPPLPTPETPPETLSQAEREARAEQRYAEGVRARDAGDHDEALIAFEAAYYLVPGRHGLAYQIGETAFDAGRSLMAREYLMHFLRYADQTKFADEIYEAKMMLGEIAVRGCDRPALADEDERWAEPQVCLNVVRRRPSACELMKLRRAQRREQRRARRNQ